MQNNSQSSGVRRLSGLQRNVLTVVVDDSLLYAPQPLTPIRTRSRRIAADFSRPPETPVHLL